MRMRRFKRLVPWLASNFWCIVTVNNLSQFCLFLHFFSCDIRLSLAAFKIDVFHWNTELVFILALLLYFLVALWLLSVLLIFIWEFSSISLSSDSSWFLLLSIGFPPETKGDTDIYTKGKISPASTVVLCDKHSTIQFKHSFTFPIVDVWISGSWSLLSNGNTSVCATDATHLEFFKTHLLQIVQETAKTIISTIYSVFKLLPPEASLINRFLTPSTS